MPHATDPARTTPAPTVSAVGAVSAAPAVAYVESWEDDPAEATPPLDLPDTRTRATAAPEGLVPSLDAADVEPLESFEVDQASLDDAELDEEAFADAEDLFDEELIAPTDAEADEGAWVVSVDEDLDLDDVQALDDLPLELIAEVAPAGSGLPAERDVDARPAHP